MVIGQTKQSIEIIEIGSLNETEHKIACPLMLYPDTKSVNTSIGKQLFNLSQLKTTTLETRITQLYQPLSWVKCKCGELAKTSSWNFPQTLWSSLTKQKLERFEDLSQKFLKMKTKVTETIKLNFSYLELSNKTRQTYLSTIAKNWNAHEDPKTVLHRMHAKPGCQGTTQGKANKYHIFSIDPTKKCSPDFLANLSECAGKTFLDEAQHVMRSLFWAK